MKTIYTAIFLVFSCVLLHGAPECTAYFSPQDHLSERLIEWIDQEKSKIQIAIYSIQHAKIANALVRAKNRGVDIEVLVDPFSVKKRSSIHKLRAVGIPLFVWDQNLAFEPMKRKRKMHDKFVVLGKERVWTGSFDFTWDAVHQQENALVIADRVVTQKYAEQFERMRLYESRSYEEYVALYPKRRKARRR